MSFIKIGEMPGGRTATMDEKGVRRYTRKWLVITDSMLQDSQTVRDAPGIPLQFDSYVTDTGIDTEALLADKQAREDHENPFRWEVDLSYSSDCTDPSQGFEKPTDRDPIYKWDYETEKEPAGAWQDGQDLDGLPLKNSVGVAFDPPLEVDVCHRMLTITRIEEDFDPDFEDNYAFSLNAEPIFGYGAGQARMDPIKAEEMYEAGNRYYKKTYVIKFRQEPYTWNLRPLDHSYVKPDGGTPPGLETIIDIKGQPTASSHLFNGMGEQINPLTDDPFYFDFRVYPKTDWGALDLE